MKSFAVLALLAVAFTAPSWAQSSSSFANDHAEVGVFADYLRFSPTDPVINFVGVGGRLGVNVHPNVQLEGEINYDFERNRTVFYDTGVGSTFVRTGVRPLSGLFGPKFQAGTSGPVRFFVTGKVGFIDFSTSGGAVNGTNFSNAINGVGNAGTHVAFYPGAGIEGFIGPVGLRLDVGDEIYLNNGAYNNLRVTFGPHFRF
jgi:hypothetical protein